MFEKSSAGNRSSSRDANYHQYRQALRYRSDRCSLGADQADVTGSPTRRPTTHNQHSRCVKRNLLSTTNRLPMAFASPESFQFGARSITTSESGRTVVSGTHVQRSMYQQARRQAGRTACPSVVIMDGQSVKTTERGGIRGFDTHKRVKGRKRQTSAACVQDHRFHLDCSCIIERSFAWLGRNRRLSKDYKYSVQTSETLIDIAATRLILNRLASA